MVDTALAILPTELPHLALPLTVQVHIRHLLLLRQLSIRLSLLLTKLLLVLHCQNAITLYHVIDSVVVAEAHILVRIRTSCACRSNFCGSGPADLLVAIGVVHRARIVLVDHLAAEALAVHFA